MSYLSVARRRDGRPGPDPVTYVVSTIYVI
jgi:hypothetical protein